MSDGLYARIHDWGNLLEANRKAALGKRGRGPAASFEARLPDSLIEIRDALRDGTYEPDLYVSFTIHEPKVRLVSAAPFRDRVVHHALCNVIEPLFESRFSAASYANRTGKGNHRALARCRQLARRYAYVLPCDVRQHFPSIDHRILRRTLARVIRDDATLDLCDRILASGEGVLDDRYDMVYFPGDDLFAVYRPRGLPIGNLTSQFWSNCYLHPVDQFVERELRCRAYVRYVDDSLLFGDDPAELWSRRERLIERLERLRLTLHEERARVRPVSEGIPWLGFVVYPTRCRLKRRNVVNNGRRLGRLLRQLEAGEVSVERLEASLEGWRAHAAHGDTRGVWRQATAVVEAVLGPRVPPPGGRG